MMNLQFLAPYFITKAERIGDSQSQIITLHYLGQKLSAKRISEDKWRVLPLMKLANESLSEKLEQIAAYIALNGNTFPNAHKNN